MLLLSLYTHVAYNEINRQLFWSKKYKEKQTKYRYRKNIKMKSITIYAKGANKNRYTVGINVVVITAVIETQHYITQQIDLM